MRESSSDPKRRRVCENPRQLGSKADSENNMTADGRACQVENSDQTAENFSAKVLTPLKTSHLLALNAQVLISPKPNKVPKTPSKSKEPIPNCIQKKMKKFKGSYTTYYYHSCDDFNYEDMKEVRAWMAENPDHESHKSGSSPTKAKCPQTLLSCMKRVKVEQKFVIRHLCDSTVFNSNSAAKSWMRDNPEHKPCPTLWFKDNDDPSGEVEKDAADEGDEQDPNVEGSDQVGDGQLVEDVVQAQGEERLDENYSVLKVIPEEKEKPASRDDDESSKAISSKRAAPEKGNVNLKEDGFDADSEEVDSDDEVKKKSLKGGKGKKGNAASLRAKSPSLITQKNAPPCMKRRDRKIENKRVSGFFHECNSQWFSSWTEAKKWLLENEDHLNNTLEKGTTDKKVKKENLSKGSDAVKERSNTKGDHERKAGESSSSESDYEEENDKVLPEPSRRNKDTQKTAKAESISSMSPLAIMEASMEAEEEGHHEMDTTETQPLDEMSKEEVESKGDLGKKSKKQGKVKAHKEANKKVDESESDSGEEMGNSKSRMVGMQLEAELEKTSKTMAGESDGRKETKEQWGKLEGNEEADATVDDKSNTPEGNLNRSEVDKIKEKEQAGPSSSDSDSGTEAFSGSEKTKSAPPSSRDETSLAVQSPKVTDIQTKSKGSPAKSGIRRKEEESSSSCSDTDTESEAEKSKAPARKPAPGVNATVVGPNKGVVGPNKGVVGPNKGGSSTESDSESEENDSESEENRPLLAIEDKSAVSADKTAANLSKGSDAVKEGGNERKAGESSSSESDDEEESQKT